MFLADPKTKVQTTEVKSNLSPFAAEFVPRFAMTYTAQPVVTNGAWNDYQPQDEAATNPELPEPEDFVALSELRDFIDTISIKPNKFDSHLPYLTDIMNNWIGEDDVVMESVVNTIVDQVIKAAILYLSRFHQNFVIFRLSWMFSFATMESGFVFI